VSPQENPPNATNVERAESNSAGGLILSDDSTSDASQWPAETAPKALMMPSGYASGAGLPPMWGN